jgi:hypothetical protein
MFTKKAIKYTPGDSVPHLDCECGHKLSLPRVNGLPMTYECVCGITYGPTGIVIIRPIRAGKL